MYMSKLLPLICGAALCLPAALAAQEVSEPIAAAPIVEESAPAAGAAPIKQKNLLQVLRDGGPMMIPIGVCSVLLLVFVFERLTMLRRGRVIPKPFVKRFLEQLGAGQLDREQALELCTENKSPVAEVFAGAVKKWGRPAVEVEQSLIDAGERVSNELRRYLRLFSGISTIAPLLGLLGTVTGMISSFNVLSQASAANRPEMLAAGISEALLTTAGGLLVAIPATVAYLFFVGRVDRLVMELDALGQQVVERISAESSQSTSRRAKAA